MAVSTNKKVLITRFDRETLSGFVNPQTYLAPAGLELLSASGTISQVPYPEVKAVCFVKDFDSGDFAGEKRAFATRPKTAGLWMRFQFRDGDQMEGLLPNNLLQIEPEGFTIAPPGASFQNQRIFIPRTALSGVQVLGVVGSPLRPKRAAKPAEQLDMFEREP